MFTPGMASGAVFMLLQSCLGITFFPEKPQLYFHHPQLSDYLERVHISNLRVGSGTIDLVFRRHLNDVAINVLSKEGDIDIMITV